MPIQTTQVHRQPRTFIRGDQAKLELPDGGFIVKLSSNKYIRTFSGWRPHLVIEGVEPESLIDTKVILSYPRNYSSAALKEPVIFKGFGRTMRHIPCLRYIPQNAKDKTPRILTLSQTHSVVVAPVPGPFLIS